MSVLHIFLIYNSFLGKSILISRQRKEFRIYLPESFDVGVRTIATSECHKVRFT